MLKSSSALAGIQTIGRVTLSLFPLVWAKTRIMRFMSKLIDIEKHPDLAAKQAALILKSRRLHWWTAVLLAIPFSLIGLVALASSERTPLTGRWRVILLSPAEEEAISTDLRGNKWYEAVREILTTSSGGQPPVVLSPADWRWAWVEETLRRLERAILTLHNLEGYREAYEHHLKTRDRHLYPPPPKYPLLPRGRATTLLHEMPKHSDLDHERAPSHPEAQTHHIAPHTQLGPPYSLLVIEKDESNAFSYGFGPGGAGGVVVYSGFLDDILRDTVRPTVQTPPASPPRSAWSSVFSTMTPAPSPPPYIPDHIPPTPEQTSRLATLLAHELAHLVLSHHIETLSKGTILFPSIISIGVDTIRSLLYPLTFIVGPFFSDALDRTLRMGFDDLAKAGEACTNTSLEIEADVISARILALAGFDPKESIEFWKTRVDCASAPKGKAAHPVFKERLDAIAAELASWETEKTRTLQRLQAQPAA